jgi:hypothetical protein
VKRPPRTRVGEFMRHFVRPDLSAASPSQPTAQPVDPCTWCTILLAIWVITLTAGVLWSHL